LGQEDSWGSLNSGVRSTAPALCLDPRKEEGMGLEEEARENLVFKTDNDMRLGHTSNQVVNENKPQGSAEEVFTLWSL
jgi:hypothetical protein